jgi:peptidoglycan/LPS O-acetylase OafA/YrhL
MGLNFKKGLVHPKSSWEVQSSPNRFDELDALRFALASWVALGHFRAFPLFGNENHLTGLIRLFARGFETLVWGPPAVMAFFVISGFCIHYPVRSGQSFPILAFYGRRYTRILLPLAAALLLMRLCVGSADLFGPHSVLWNGTFWNGTLWSLLCEEIYYAIYPMVRWLRNRAGWTPLLATATAMSVLTSIWNHGSATWWELGPLSTAVVLYPVWLLGSLLAEQADTIVANNSMKDLWTWRLGAWIGMWVAEMLNFHGRIFLTTTLAPFGVFSYYWIRNEIACHKLRRPPALFCWGGKWSYSLYLIHPVAITFLMLKLHNISPISKSGWLVSIGMILVSSYVFYLLVERPAHLLAKTIRFAPNGRRVFDVVSGIDTANLIETAKYSVPTSRAAEGAKD